MLTQSRRFATSGRWQWLDKLISRLVEPGRLHAWHLNEANRQYQRANANLAVRHYRKCLEIFPEHWRTYQLLAITCMQLIGDVEEALRLFRFARRLRERLFSPRGGKPPYRYLDYMWVAQIGHIANMEHLIKRDILLGRNSKDALLYFPESARPANQALLDKMGMHITVVRDPSKLPHPPDTMLSVLEEYYLCESLDGLTKHWWHASPEIFRAWEEAGRGPLLTLSDEERARGRACLKSLGVPDDAWFVCLHVRESGFKQQHGYGTVESILNADIDAYAPAIRAIIERGGWVVRVGDSKMRPLAPMPNTADYARSAVKSDWMDVFLLGACRFFIGTSSGPAYVPPLFGIPCVLTNWAPFGQRPFNGRDLYIPKLFRAGVPPRELSFAEMMAPPIGYAAQYVLGKALGLVLSPNTPDEIRDVVVEMLERLDGNARYSEEDEHLQSTFDAIAGTNLCIGNARIGRDFLRQHRNLLARAGHAAA